MDCATLEQDDIVDKLGANHGVLMKDNGNLCCGNNIYDAEALAMVAEKNARAWLIGRLFPEKPIQAISDAECQKMRRFYLDKYSKRF
jgi:ribulose-5-phosphate 4-epimerase/fuculose-1-phosphate aldolase